jgi:hypothetical protein
MDLGRHDLDALALELAPQLRRQMPSPFPIQVFVACHDSPLLWA